MGAKPFREDFPAPLRDLWFCRLLSFCRDEVLFEQGDPAFGLYYLHSGQVKLWRRTREGKRQLLAILQGPGPLFGLEALIGERFDTIASGLRPGQAVFIAREELPHLPGRDLLQGAAWTWWAYQQELAQTLSLRAEERLARILLREPTLVQSLRRRELAEHAGLSLEHTCRLLRQWIEHGWLRKEGHRLEVTARESLGRTAPHPALLTQGCPQTAVAVPNKEGNPPRA